MDNELCKCGKVGKISCPHDDWCGIDNTQLPAEMENKIFNILLTHTYASRAVASKELSELFAYEYASKLHEEQQENESLTNQLKHHGKVSDENMRLLRQEYTALQSKCERYETALKDISNGKIIAVMIAAKALSGEGEKEGKQWWEGKAIEDMPEYVKVIREDCAEATGLYCRVYKWSAIDNLLPDLKGQLGAELEGYEPDYLVRTDLNFPGQVYGRLNATHLLPATKEEYEAYIKAREGDNE